VKAGREAIQEEHRAVEAKRGVRDADKKLDAAKTARRAARERRGA
jgi:hypothetical protein